MSTQPAIISNQNENKESALYEAKNTAFIQLYYGFKHLYSVEQICERLEGLYGMTRGDWMRFYNSRF